MNQIISFSLEWLNNTGQWFWDYSAGMFVQASLLIIVLLVIDFLLRKRVRAVFRYCVWMLVFVKLILPPTLCLPTGIGYWFGDILPAKQSVLEPIFNMPVAESTAEPVTSHQVSGISIEPLSSPESRVTSHEPRLKDVETVAPLPAITWQMVVFLTWLTGVLVFSVLLIQRMFFVRGLIAQSEPVGDRLLDVFDQCRRQVGIRHNIELRLSNNTSSPAVCGLVRPTILVPTALCEKLSPDRIRAVLIHELVHIKRGDLWVNFVQTFLQIIYFYNPFVWLANAIVRRIREQAVDETVLVALGEGAKTYSNTLIDIAEMTFFRASFSLRLIGVAESKKSLERRIKHMLARPIPKSAKIGIFSLLAIVIVGAVLLPMAKAKESRKLLNGIDEKLKVTDKAGELTINSIYMPSPNGKSLVGTNKVTLYVDVTNNCEKDIYLGLEYYTDSGTIAKVFSPGATSLAQIKKVPANWQGKLEYPIHHNRFVKGGYVKITLARCAGKQTITEKNRVFLPPEEEIIYEKKHNIIPIDDTQPDAGALTDFSFTATLPNGVTVELVGICEHPSKGNKWWRADGTMIENDFRPYTFKELRSLRLPSNQQENKILELAVKITDSPDRNVGMICSGANRTFVNCRNNVWGGTVEIDKELDVNDFKIGVAAGAWETLATSGSKFGGRRRKTPGIVFTEAYNTQKGYAVVIVTHKKDIQKENWRVVAIDQEGNTHKADFYQTQGIGEFEQNMFHFQGLRSDQIGRFEFQIRPYRWVTFRNVSLKPNFKTDVQVEEKRTKHRILIEAQFLSVSEEFLKDVSLDANSVYNSDLWSEHILTDPANESNSGTYNLILDDLQVSFLLRATQAHKGAKKLTAPRVTVWEGEEAQIATQRAMHYVSGYTETNQASGKPIPKTDSVMLGTTLWIKPDLTSDNKNIKLDFESEIRRHLGFEEHRYKGKYPYKSPKVEVISTAKHAFVPDGKTLLVGGQTIITEENGNKIQKKLLVLIKARKAESQSGVPMNRKYLPVVKEADVQVEGENGRQRSEDGLSVLATAKTGGQEPALSKIEGSEDRGEKQFIATLPNGMTVELVGVCEHPSEGKQWWKPDGTLLKEAPYDKFVETPFQLENLFSEISENVQRIELALRITTPTEIPPRIGWRMESIGYMFLMKNISNKGHISPQLKALLAEVPSKDRTIEIKLIINGSWIKFKNISLRPGAETDVQIEVEKPDVQVEEKKVFPIGDYALEFDGIDDFLEIHASESLQLGRHFTIQMWVKPEFPDISIPDKERNLLSKGGYILGHPDQKDNRRAASYGFGFKLIPEERSRINFQVSTGSDQGIYSAHYIMTESSYWHHLAVVFDGEKGLIYRGARFGLSEESYKLAPERNIIVGGKFLIPMGNYFKGQIAELRIWNRALNLDEIAEFKTMALSGSEPSLVGCWTFEQTEGQRAIDISPYKNHARLGSTYGVDNYDPTWVRVATKKEVEKPDVQVELENGRQKSKDSLSVVARLPRGSSGGQASAKTGGQKSKTYAVYADSKFSATLANGIKVELVGVCEYPSEGKQWWKPDGVMLTEAPYDKIQEPHSRHLPSGIPADKQGYEVALNIVTPTETPPRIGWRMESRGEMYYMEKVLKNGRSAPQLRAFLFVVSSKDKTIEIKFHINNSWIRFKNVSLQPGVKTDVQVEGEEP